MKKILLLLFALSLGCSSFGIRTSTQIPYIQAGDNAQIHLHLDGSIPGSEIESNVPIDKILLEVVTRLREQTEMTQEQNPQQNNQNENEEK